MPVEPHGTFSVITPKLSCTVLFPHLFLKERDSFNMFSLFAYSVQRPLITLKFSLNFLVHNIFFLFSKKV